MESLIACLILAAVAYCLWTRYRAATDEKAQLKCVISRVDGETYCVRDRKRLQQAADLLAKVTQRCNALVMYVKQHYSADADVQRLVAKFNPNNIMETLPTSVHTAYSENKGEKVAFCLNANTKSGNDDADTLIDLETLTFVAIHELSHIMTESEGHKQEFWQNFKFLLENAKQAGIHQPVNYKETPQKYCSMTISDNPYYDL